MDTTTSNMMVTTSCHENSIAIGAFVDSSWSTITGLPFDPPKASVLLVGECEFIFSVERCTMKGLLVVVDGGLLSAKLPWSKAVSAVGTLASDGVDCDDDISVVAVETVVPTVDVFFS